MQKQKLLCGISQSIKRDSSDQKKPVQTDGNEAGVTQHFLGTGKSSKESIN